ncbi:MAG: PEP-CTERM sorting domain-containing protein [Candidatus Binatia bacterium]
MIVTSLATAHPLADDLISGSVNVHPKRAIPDPSTMVLPGSGLAGLGFFRQRKRIA